MKYLYLCFVYSCLFPWLSFGILDMDIQPYFILLSGVILFVNIKTKIKLEIWLLLLMFFVALFIALIEKRFDFLTIRAMVSYFSFFSVSAAIYILRKKQSINFIQHLYVANVIWLLSGFLQAGLGKEILSFLVHVRTTDDRGVTGLAPEPTFFAVYLIFLTWLIIKENGYFSLSKNTKILILLNILSIILLAKSSMGVLFVALLMALFYVVNIFSSIKNLVKLAIFVCIIGFIGNIVSEQLSDTRIGRVVGLLIDTPLLIVQSDASINERSKHVIYPIHGAILSDFIPYGFHSFAGVSNDLDRIYKGFFWWGEQNNKIMSGLGSAIFELGFFSVIYIFYIYKSLFVIKNRGLCYFEFIGVSSLMLSAIPLSFPLFHFFLVSSFFSTSNIRNASCNMRIRYTKTNDNYN